MTRGAVSAWLADALMLDLTAGDPQAHAEMQDRHATRRLRARASGGRRLKQAACR